MGSSTFISEYLRTSASDEELERVLALCEQLDLSSNGFEKSVANEDIAARSDYDGEVRLLDQEAA